MLGNLPASVDIAPTVAWRKVLAPDKHSGVTLPLMCFLHLLATCRATRLVDPSSCSEVVDESVLELNLLDTWDSRRKRWLASALDRLRNLSAMAPISIAIGNGGGAD